MGNFELYKNLIEYQDGSSILTMKEFNNCILDPEVKTKWIQTYHSTYHL